MKDRWLRGARRHLGATIFIAALVINGTSSAAEASVYVNEEFRLSVDVPAGAPTCRSQPPEHDHGIDIFLDHRLDGCQSRDTRPYLGVSGGYNAALYKSPDAALGDVCHFDGATRAAAPPGLAIADLRTASCRADSPDKSWIFIFAKAQAGDLGENADVNYGAYLHTTPQRFDADLARFRAFLKAIKVFEDSEPTED